nr:ETC complex I subunit [Rhizobium leguminosarum]
MQGWRLVFERRSAPFIEPLMGYTGCTDTLTQVELEFPTLESAIRYAERQGLTYTVQRQMSKAAAAKQRTSRRTYRPSTCLLRRYIATARPRRMSGELRTGTRRRAADPRP